MPNIVEKIPNQNKVTLPAGLTGNSDNFIGVLGMSNSGTGVAGKSTTGEGVEGSGMTAGVHGISSSLRTIDSGVLGENQGKGIGVSGTSRGGVGVYGKGATLAGQFDGPVTVSGDLNANASINASGDINANGNVNVTGDVILTGSDCAEDFDVSSDIEPGSVVVIDASGALRESALAYDKKVAGVISGAGNYNPAIIMGKKQEDVAVHRRPLALSGKVYCKADAQFAPIEVGDLLTTSPTPGCAMKASDPNLAFGSVIGKAMDRLESGRGLVRILISLQ